VGLRSHLLSHTMRLESNYK